MGDRIGRHKPLPRPAEPPYALTRISVGKARESIHYVVTLNPEVADDVGQFLRQSKRYRVGDGVPLCANELDQHPPAPDAQPCGSCEAYLEMFEEDLDDARWAKAQETLAWSAIDEAVRNAVRERSGGIGW